MGWSLGVDSSRPHGDQEIGYGVPATCEHEGCNKKIDRGLAYACGGQPYEDSYYCNRFFCYTHLYFTPVELDGVGPVCRECYDRLVDVNDEYIEEYLR